MLLLAGCAGAPRGPVVTQIDFTGAKQVSAGDIEDRIATSQANFFSYVFGPVPTFDPTTWAADLRRIERYYQALGYYQAEVVDEEVLPDGKGGVRLNLSIDEGLPTHVTAIEIEGLDIPEELRQRVLRKLPLQVGAVFREAEWAALKAELKSRLHELGYADAAVGGESDVEVTNQTARVHLLVDPGPRVKFGSIFVTSGPHPEVRPELIIATARPGVPLDAWFSESALEDAQTRVFKMGVFGAVKVTVGRPDATTDTVPVLIDVREAPFHTVRYGGGLGFDPARQEVRATAEYVDRNFLGGLRQLTLKAKVGWAFVPAVWDIQTNGLVLDFSAQFQQPNFFAPTLKFLASVNLYKQVEAGYGYIGGRGRVGVAWEPVPRLVLSPTYAFELDQVTGVTSGLTGDAPLLAYGCESSPCLQRLGYFEQTVVWDARDDIVDAKRGYYLGVSFQESGAWSGSGYDYIRILPEARAYLTVGTVTFAARVMVGTILQPHPCSISAEAGLSAQACDPSPIVNRFFAGGAGSNRGFGSRQLSPLLPLANQPLTPSAAAGSLVAPVGQPAQYVGYVVPIGGNGLLDTSLELRWAFAREWVLAFFVDAGFVSYGAFSWDDLSTTQVAVGIGLRYRTPVGLLRIDFGYRLNFGGPLPVVPVQPGVRYTSNTGCIAFSSNDYAPNYAGAPWSRCALSFAIGESF
ncbi:MAG: outer membrane protein assembly factor [Myxococcaceae bacterium]